MDHFVVRDGLVVSNFVIFDQMQFARKVGCCQPTGRCRPGVKAAFNAKTALRTKLHRDSGVCCTIWHGALPVPRLPRR